MIALAIKDQYEDENEFYDECMEIILENTHLLSAGETADQVFIDINEDEDRLKLF